MEVGGALLQAYIVCSRQAWLLAHQITGDQSNDFLEIGRYLSEETYKRDKKEIQVGRNKIDIIRNSDNCVTIIEVKKSSKMLDASKIQLLHYMYSFFKLGYHVKGELRIPEEKKIIPLEFSETQRQYLDNVYIQIEEVIYSDKIPSPNRIGAEYVKKVVTIFE